jgi:HAD superfamily hydrolase (TIGR01509 family)
VTKPDIKAVIFDLDGLVLDTEITFVQAWRAAAQQLGFSLSQAFLHSLSGLPHAEVQQVFLQHCGADFDYARFTQLSVTYWQELVTAQSIPVKLGLFPLLHGLHERHIPYCLATNSQRADALNCLQLAGIAELFPLLISRDEVVYPKPAPDIFLKAVSILGVASQNCLVLEDSATGVAAAYAANAPCIYIPSTYPAHELAMQQALGTVADLSQVLAYLS